MHHEFIRVHTIRRPAPQVDRELRRLSTVVVDKPVEILRKTAASA
jgi:hypothetical protein